MKNNKKKKVMATAILIGTIMVIAGCLWGFSLSGDAEEVAINGVVEALETQLKIGVLPVDALQQQIGFRNAASEQEIVEAVADQERPDFFQHFSQERALNYQNYDQAALDNVNLDEVLVDSGVLQHHLISSETVSETERKLKMSSVGWLTSIYHYSDSYAVYTIFNKDTAVYGVVLEDDMWKIIGNEEYHKEFAPDEYEPLKGSFSNLDEALACVRNLDMEQENPF